MHEKSLLIGIYVFVFIGFSNITYAQDAERSVNASLPTNPPTVLRNVLRQSISKFPSFLSNLFSGDDIKPIEKGF